MCALRVRLGLVSVQFLLIALTCLLLDSGNICSIEYDLSAYENRFKKTNINFYAAAL